MFILCNGPLPGADGEGNLIFSQGHDGKIVHTGVSWLRRPEDVQEVSIELSVQRANLHGEHAAGIVWHTESVMNGVGCPWRNLVVVEGDEDVLYISLVDPAAVSAQDNRVDKMRPWIHDASFILATTVADGLTIESYIDLDPYLV